MLASLVLLLAGTSAAMAGGHEAPARADRAGAPHVEQLLARASAAQQHWRSAEQYVNRRVAPLERVLLEYGSDPELAKRVAVALVREANRTALEPRLLLAVLLVENPMVDPSARSPVGAVGLMQVMPLHRGNWPQCDRDLEDVDANICYGAHIFAAYYRAERDPDRALLRYNGCVKGTNTPDCHTYPWHVYARAGRASILAWLTQRGGGAASP